MTCTVTRPDPQALWNQVESRFSATVLGGAPVIPESNEFYVVALQYAKEQEIYAFADRMASERDPRYMCCENLTEYGARRGMYPKPAAFAQGYVRITGASGSAMPSSLRFQFGGQVYENISTILPTMPSAGEMAVRVVALEAGPSGNVGALTGQMTTSVTGVDSAATVYGGRFCGGAVAENCEDFRTRVLNREAYSPKFTSQWLVEKIKEWPCVTDVCEPGPECCEIAPEGAPTCPDRFNFYVLFRDTFDCGLAPACMLEEITDWLFGVDQGRGLGEAEYGICGQILYAKAAKIDVVLDGLGCASPLQVQTIQERITDFVGRLCPATALTVESLRLIVAQVLGPTFSFDVVLRSPDVTSPIEGLTFSSCGDAVPLCGYKVCINAIQVVNPILNVSNCR